MSSRNNRSLNVNIPNAHQSCQRSSCVKHDYKGQKKNLTSKILFTLKGNREIFKNFVYNV